MKLYTSTNGTTYELSPSDLANPGRLARLARDAALGDMVYVPTEDPARTLDGRASRSPRRPDKHRVDALRVALRARGRELLDHGAFHWEIVER